MLRFNRFLKLILLTMLSASLAHAHNGHIISADAVRIITIDGDLSDWPKGMKTHFISNVVYVYDAPEEDGFVGRFRVGYDSKENAIFVAVEVEDDSIVLDNIGDEDWNSRDGCELFFCFQHAEKNASPLQFVYRGEPYAVFENARTDEFNKAVKVARASDDNRLLFEWRVDLEKLSGKNRNWNEGGVIGFDVAFLDRDSEDSYAFYSSSPGSTKHLQADQLGDLVLNPADTKTVQIAGRAVWKKSNQGSPKLLTFQDTDNESMFFQLPLVNGQFMATLPQGSYALTASSGRNNKTVSQITELDLKQDTLLKEPIAFSTVTKTSGQVVLYDIAHGQRAVPEWKELANEAGFSLRNSKQAITPDLLKGVDALCLLGPNTRFSEAEIDAVVEFVEVGGSLLIVVDESRRMSLEKTSANEILKSFGLKFTGDTEYIHNCGGIAKASAIHREDLEIPYSGGRAVDGGTPFAFLLAEDGKASQPFGAYVETSQGGKVIALAEAMAALFLGTQDGERLSGTPRNYFETKYWGKDSKQFNADLMTWLLKHPKRQPGEETQALLR